MSDEPTKIETTKSLVPIRSILKSLMLGLIYPAVLGSIFYTFIGETGKQLPALFNSETRDEVLVVKFLLLVITLIFYLFDYLYIIFTKDFHPLFFIFDLIFVGFLYRTVVLIGIGESMQTQAPNLQGITICYLIFMGLYLIWDLIERFGKSKGILRCVEKEKGLYNLIILWEVISIILLLVYLWILPSHFNQGVLGKVLIGLLSFITTCFGILTLLKAKYYPWPKSEV
jgi:hypothetical protein